MIIMASRLTVSVITVLTFSKASAPLCLLLWWAAPAACLGVLLGKEGVYHPSYCLLVRGVGYRGVAGAKGFYIYLSV